MDLEGFSDATDILRAGVYALVKANTVIYIGKSKRMLSRIDQHRRVYTERRRGASWLADQLGLPGILFDEVHICPCRLDQLDELERKMITKYQPRYNTKLRTPGRLPEVMNIRGVSINLAPRPVAAFERRF